LPEVEMTCSRVLIMRRGKILVSDTPENLQKTMSNGQIIVEIAAPLAALQSCWEEFAEIEHFDIAPTDGEYQRCALTPANGEDLRPRIFSLVKDRGWTMRELSRSRHSLEDIYMRITRPEQEEEIL
jgi:ABC-2 type transport system ATP-binding protein